MGAAARDRLLALTDADSLRRDVLARHVAALDNLDDLYIFGTGLMGGMVFDYCQARGIGVRGFADNDPKKQGQALRGLEVLEPETLMDCGDPVVIIASQYLHDIDQQLNGLGISRRLPYPALYLLETDGLAPEPAFAGMCEDLAANGPRYGALFPRLADERSREVLDGLLLFRATLDPQYPWQAHSPHQQYFDPVVELSHKESFVDGGAYDGDTARSFIERTGGRFRRIYLFEPDEALLGRARESLRDHDGIEYIPCGLGQRRELLNFEATGGLDGRIAGEGGVGHPVVQVQVAPLDELVEGEITYLKLDVEGAEPDALRGAASHLLRSRPKIAVAVYHESSHLWQIPELIDSLCPGYQFYLRHYSQTALETILYAIPGQASAK